MRALQSAGSSRDADVYRQAREAAVRAGCCVDFRNACWRGKAKCWSRVWRMFPQTADESTDVLGSTLCVGHLCVHYFLPES